MATFMSRLKRFDVYREVPSDLTEPTAAGGALSVVALATMALLFLSELASFLTTETTNTMFVDPSTDGPDSRITINMDITMHALPCSSQ